MTVLPPPFTTPAPLSIDDVTVLWGGHVDHAEGVAADVDPGGAPVVWAGGEAGQVYRDVLAAPTADGPGDADRVPTIVATLPGRLLGICLDGGGNAYIAADLPAGLFRVSPGGAVTRLASIVDGRPLVLPNHPGFLPDGTLLCTDSGTWEGADGRTVFVTPDGGAGTADDTAAHFPNGLCVSPDGSHVWIVESVPPRLIRLDAEPGGRLGGRQVVADLLGVIPDGVLLLADGRPVVTCWTPDALLVVDPDDGSHQVLVHDHRRFVLNGPTNAAIIPGTTTLVTANYGERALARLLLDTPGAPPPRPVVPPFPPAPA